MHRTGRVNGLILCLFLVRQLYINLRGKRLNPEACLCATRICFRSYPL